MIAAVANQQEHIFKGERSSLVSWHLLQHQHRVLRQEREEFETNYVERLCLKRCRAVPVNSLHGYLSGQLWATVAGLGNSLGKVDYMES